MQEPVKSKRQLQAEQTRKKLYDAAVELLEDKSYREITIRDIVKRVDVSIGTFYKYFESKRDVFYETYAEADHYFYQEIAPQLTLPTCRENVLLFFECYAEYCSVKTSIRMTRLLYNPDNHFFNRVAPQGMHSVLRDVIARGEAEGCLRNGCEVHEVVEDLMIAARGLVYNWCTHQASYNLIEAMKRYMDHIVNAFIQA